MIIVLIEALILIALLSCGMPSDKFRTYTEGQCLQFCPYVAPEPCPTPVPDNDYDEDSEWSLQQSVMFLIGLMALSTALPLRARTILPNKYQYFQNIL